MADRMLCRLRWCALRHSCRELGRKELKLKQVNGLMHYTCEIERAHLRSLSSLAAALTRNE